MDNNDAPAAGGGHLPDNDSIEGVNELIADLSMDGELSPGSKRRRGTGVHTTEAMRLARESASILIGTIGQTLQKRISRPRTESATSAVSSDAFSPTALSDFGSGSGVERPLSESSEQTNRTLQAIAECAEASWKVLRELDVPASSHQINIGGLKKSISSPGVDIKRPKRRGDTVTSAFEELVLHLRTLRALIELPSDELIFARARRNFLMLAVDSSLRIFTSLLYDKGTVDELTSQFMAAVMPKDAIGMSIRSIERLRAASLRGEPLQGTSLARRHPLLHSPAMIAIMDYLGSLALTSDQRKALIDGGYKAYMAVPRGGAKTPRLPLTLAETRVMLNTMDASVALLYFYQKARHSKLRTKYLDELEGAGGNSDRVRDAYQRAEQDAAIEESFEELTATMCIAPLEGETAADLDERLGAEPFQQACTAVQEDALIESDTNAASVTRDVIAANQRLKGESKANYYARVMNLVHVAVGTYIAVREAEMIKDVASGGPEKRHAEAAAAAALKAAADLVAERKAIQESSMASGAMLKATSGVRHACRCNAPPDLKWTKSSNPLECTNCAETYHADCIGYSKEERKIESESGKWICPACLWIGGK
jgi:hypothetical protein